MALITDTFVKNAKAGEKPREVRVDDCLYLRVTLKAGKTMKKWLLRYTDSNGKGQRYIFGEYPDIGLLEARTRAAELLKQAKCVETLARVAKRGKICRTLADTAAEWFAKMSEGWVAHIEDNTVRAAYNRINSRSWLDERRRMLQAYADYPDKLKRKASGQDETDMILEREGVDRKEKVAYTDPVNEWPDEQEEGEMPSLDRATELITERNHDPESEFGFELAPA